MSILTLALITAAIVAAYSSTSAEVVSNNAQRAQDHAYQLAEAGLQQFVLRRNESGFCTNCVANPAVADSEWTRVSFPGSGYADVVAMRVRPKINDATPALFFIRSTGVDTTVKLGGAGITVFATRRIGYYASFGTSSIKPLAAWTSLNGVRNNARSLLANLLTSTPGTGVDQCATPAASIAGLVVPGPAPADRQYIFPPGTLNILFVGTVATPHPQGTPGVDSAVLLDTLKRRAGIDWNAIKNYDAIPADITIPSGSFPSAATFTADTSYWPVVRVKGNFSTTHAEGRGILIVDGDLYVDDGDGFDGIILVGGRLKTRASGTIEGAVVSGLDLTLPGSVNPPASHSIDNDTILTSTLPLIGPLSFKRINYNSCKANRAAQALKMYFVWPNTWLDNVAIW